MNVAIVSYIINCCVCKNKSKGKSNKGIQKVVLMDTSTSINQSRSNQQFGMVLKSITDYKNNLLMTLLGTPQGQSTPYPVNNSTAM